MSRVLKVARVHLVNAPVTVGMPWVILGLAFTVNLLLFGSLLDGVGSGDRSTGALMSIYIVVGIAQLQTMTQGLPFAIGMSVTRRTFYAATALVAAAEAVVFAILLALLALLERATGGWGISLHFFDLPFLRQGNPAQQVLVYTVPFLATASLGVFIGLVFKRWGQMGMYALTIGTAIPAALLVFLATKLDWWPSVGRFFTDQSTFALLAGYPLIIAALLAGAGYLVLRRVTP